ncbi:MAG: SPOR domain-containing protein [Nitrosomonas sp.]|uniref:SPOR domain-containing protein n=1 Tax=Nitrosomonas sp. TaxID=42353 RepID=UPI0025ECBC72|nr:SPOR domain-containing protein [Nitrosomonas sp.]MBE7527749.1 SPOR domain-containing protein [Burkholderiales bacterium]MCC6160678.1 SPOR domain-containing protein [Nitrosomonas sp.]
MSRDYKSRNSARSQKNGSSLWLGLFAGYTLGLASAIGVWLYISQAPSPFLNGEKTARNPSSEKSVTRQTQPAPADKQAKKAESSAKQADTSESRFDFYKILPGIDEPPEGDLLDLTPLPPATAVAPQKIPEKTVDKPVEKVTEKAPEPKDRYFLQAGSFKNSSDAERMKAELALLGIIASVQPGRSEGNVPIHRVRIGPFGKMEELDRVRASLQENGIAANLVRVQ